MRLTAKECRNKVATLVQQTLFVHFGEVNVKSYGEREFRIRFDSDGGPHYIRVRVTMEQ
jgi:hypothetical protein